MSDIVQRLRAHKADIWNWNGAAMTAWDSWRAAIASGDKSSWPRDAFESLIGAYGEDMEEAADEIARLEAEVKRMREALEDALDRRGIARRLAARYNENPARIADLCDSAIDRTGRLLGYVREEARAAISSLIPQAPLGSEFEAVWDANTDKLYES